MQKFWAVVPAAGQGKRMQSALPKQYLPLGGKTVIEHTLAKLLAVPALSRLIVAADSKAALEPYSIGANARVQVTLGGAERAESVLQGLRALLEAGAHHRDWVLVHDAARPCVTVEAITQLLSAVKQFDVGDNNVDVDIDIDIESKVEGKDVIKADGENDSTLAYKNHGAILAIPVADTLKKALPMTALAMPVIDKTVPRDQLWQAHTPQCFRIGALRDALEHATKQGLQVTDEASAMEYAGGVVHLVEDNRSNIKITHPADLALAEAILQQQTAVNMTIKDHTP